MYDCIIHVEGEEAVKEERERGVSREKNERERKKWKR